MLNKKFGQLMRSQVEQRQCEDIAAFRVCSRRCKQLSDAHFYRDVRLEEAHHVDERRWREKAWGSPPRKLIADERLKGCIERLLQPQDAMSTHVRHLSIGPWRPRNSDEQVTAARQTELVIGSLTQILTACSNILDFRYVHVSCMCADTVLH